MKTHHIFPAQFWALWYIHFILYIAFLSIFSWKGVGYTYVRLTYNLWCKDARFQGTVNVFVSVLNFHSSRWFHWGEVIIEGCVVNFSNIFVHALKYFFWFLFSLDHSEYIFNYIWLQRFLSYWLDYLTYLHLKTL